MYNWPFIFHECPLKSKKQGLFSTLLLHNIYYLDLADEVLPKDVYEKGPFNNFIIIYKKGIKLGETVLCRYGLKRETHIIKIENSEKKTNAIIKLWWKSKKTYVGNSTKIKYP